MIRIILICLKLLYIVSPVDLLPEIVFGPIGYIDDVIVFIMVVFLIYRECASRNQSPPKAQTHQNQPNQPIQTNQVVHFQGPIGPITPGPSNAMYLPSAPPQHSLQQKPKKKPSKNAAGQERKVSKKLKKDLTSAVIDVVEEMIM